MKIGRSEGQFLVRSIQNFELEFFFYIKALNKAG